MESKKVKVVRVPSIDTISPFSIDSLSKSIRRSSRCCLQPDDIILVVNPAIANQAGGNEMLSLMQQYCKRENYELVVEDLKSVFPSEQNKCIVALSEHLLVHPRAAPIHTMINPDYLHVSINPMVYCYGAERLDVNIYDDSVAVIPPYIANTIGAAGKNGDISIKSIVYFAFSVRPPVMFLQEDWNLYPDICNSFFEERKYSIFKNLKNLSKEERIAIINSHFSVLGS